MIEKKVSKEDKIKLLYYFYIYTLRCKLQQCAEISFAHSSIRARRYCNWKYISPWQWPLHVLLFKLLIFYENTTCIYNSYGTSDLPFNINTLKCLERFSVPIRPCAHNRTFSTYATDVAITLPRVHSQTKTTRQNKQPISTTETQYVVLLKY